jgi:hypothetical protein
MKKMQLTESELVSMIEKIVKDIKEPKEKTLIKVNELRNIIENIIKETYLNKDNNLNEKWNGDVKIHNTGENTDKTIDDLENELENIKKQSKKYQDRGEKVPEKLLKKEHQLEFAIRAKKHWK